MREGRLLCNVLRSIHSADTWTQDLQTSLGVSFRKCCLSLQLFFSSDDFRWFFFAHQDVEISRFSTISSKMIAYPIMMHGYDRKSWKMMRKNDISRFHILQFCEKQQVLLSFSLEK